jgi:hypothetical protein
VPHRDHKVVAFAVLLLAATVSPALSAPLFELADDGRTFLYRARPGEPPAAVAQSFGVPEDGLPAFLAASGIRDATRVPLGFEYRIPNPLGPRLEALAGEIERLDHALTARTARVTELERTLEEVRAQAAFTEAKERRLAALETRWPVAVTALVVALLALAGALWVARLSVHRLTGVEHRAQALAHELEERRRADLAERQEAGRQIMELGNRLRQLEHQPPRLVTAGS